MARKQVLRNICMLAMALALCAGLLAVPTREARAVESQSTITGITGGDSCTYGGTAPTYTVEVDLRGSETVASYAWTADGTYFSTEGATTNAATFTPTIKQAGDAASVTCEVVFQDATQTTPVTYDSRSASKPGITVGKATRTLEITSGNATIAPGGSYTPTRTVSAGESDGTIVWSISPTNANVSIDTTTGAVTTDAVAGACDTYTVTARITNGTNYNDANDSVTVTVALADPGLTAAPASLSLVAGGDAQVVSHTTNGSGAVHYALTACDPAGYVELTENAGVYKVKAVGGATDTATATVTITQDAAGIYAADSATCTITASKAATTISGVPATVALAMTESYTYAATSSNTGAGAPAITYAVTSGADVVSIDAAHKITPLKEGTATVTVSQAATNTHQAASVTSNVTVSKVTTTISGVPSTVNLAMTGSYTYAATSSNTGTGAPAITYAVTSGTDVVSIDATTHKITPLKAGTATVTVSQAATNTHKAASVTSNVTVGASASKLSASSASLTSVSGTGSTTISVDYPTEAYDFAVVSNSNPLVASVKNTALTNTSATFQVTAHKAGTTQIVFSAKGKTSGTSLASQTYSVSVTLPASTISLDGWYDHLYKDRRYNEITAYVKNPGSPLDEGSAVDWWVDDDRILDVVWFHDKVQRDGNTYFSRVRLKALRSGTTYARVRMADGTTASYKIVVHMGSYIPQTGQDSTAIYVVGALLLLSAGATAFVYGKRRRSRS